jgi:hypothetical protein
MVKAAHQESWDNYISSIEHDVHGHQLNAYKIMKHHNTAEKDSTDIKVINEERWLEYFKRQCSKKDQMEADNEEISTAIFSTSTIGIDPIELYELEEVLLKCKIKKHPGVDKITVEMIKYASIDVKI